MRLLILGAGVSGLGAARLGRRLGHRVTVYDRRIEAGAELLGEGVSVITGAWEPDLLAGIELVVASPGIPLRAQPITDAFEAGTPVWSELEFAWRELNCPVVAVTGTNGKTTTTEATAAMLAASGHTTAMAGNIGVALSDVATEPLDVVVVEASSFQLELTELFHPKVAVLLNIAPDHLDWHPSFAAYVAAKRKIFARQQPTDLLVYDQDDEGVSRVVAELYGRQEHPRLVPVSGNRRPPGGYGPEAGTFHLPNLDLSLLELPDRNPLLLVDLAAAAVAAADQGADPEGIASVCRQFRSGPHRRSLVAEWRGISFVDDSKATNPHAALASINSYRSVILIAGGLAKGLDLTPLARAAPVKFLIAMGESAPVLVESAPPGRAVVVGSMSEAVTEAIRWAEGGDTILLAPGCASFDMYASYAARGDAFAESVHERVQGGAA